MYEAKFYPNTVKIAAYETLESSKKDVEWTNTYIDSIEEWLFENDYNGTTTEETPGGSTKLKANFDVLLVVLMFILILI